MFFLCASSLPLSRVRRTRFVRREQGFWLVPYVLGLGGFPFATVVASHSGGALGGALCPHSPLELRWVPLASRAGGWSVDRNMRSFSRRLAHGTRFCTFLHLLASCVDSPLPNVAYHSLMCRVSVLACRGFFFGHRSVAERGPMLFCARYGRLRLVPPACWLHADVGGAHGFMCGMRHAAHLGTERLDFWGCQLPCVVSTWSQGVRVHGDHIASNRTMIG